MAGKEIDVEIIVDNTGIKTLRQELRETTIALQQATDPALIDRLTQEAGQLKDRMSDVNAEINAMASGSKFEKVAGSLGLVGQSLSNMDFAEASERAMLFAKTAKTITFKDAITSVKSFGSTFMTIGKAILSNPLFLIVGILVLIGVAVVKLLDKLGFLKVIFEAIGDVVDFLIQGLKDFLDWIGLTNFAVEDAAAKQAAMAEDVAVAMEDKSARVTQGLDHEIRMAELEGKSTIEFERKKVKAIQSVAKARAESDIAAYKSAKLSGDLDEKELKALERKALVSIDALAKSTDDINYFEAKVIDDKKKTDEKTAKTTAETNKKASEKRKQNQDKINAEIEKAVEFNKQAQKQNELDLLTAQEKEIQIVKDKYKVQIDQAIKYKQDYSQITIAQKNDINDINVKFANEELAQKQLTQDKIDALELEYKNSKLSEIEAEKLAVTEKYKVAIDQATKAGLSTQVLEENQKLLLDGIDKKAIENKKAGQLEFASWMNTFQIDERAKYVADVEAKEAEAKVKLDGVKTQGLIDEQTYQDALKVIQKKTIDDVAEHDKKIAKDLKDERLQKLKEYVDASTGLFTALGDLAVAASKKDVKSQEAAARAKFKIDKAVALTNVAMNTAVAISKHVGNPFLVGLAIATGIAQSAVIAKKQFNSGSSTTTPPSDSPPPPTENQPNATPSFNLFGTGGTANNQNASGNNGNGQNITVTAIVSEIDMTYTQDRAKQMKSSASL